ncbi:DoxX family protein [Sphingobacteriales bacterium UPWRP_1]|nr:hypothetical protein B6N25_08235 [Sphingobacteriales bacterium TSM_CSS]PSJ76296.1 DoxX family protein [Sphingobacteriales bacterium UPWRP_1]
MDLNLTRIGQILFGLTFLGFGISHLVFADNMAGIVPLPGGVIWVYLTGIAQILAFVSIVIKKKTRLACLLLALMLLIFILTIHLKSAMSGDLTGFLKDLGLMGAALVIANQFGND